MASNLMFVDRLKKRRISIHPFVRNLVFLLIGPIPQIRKISSNAAEHEHI